MNLRVHTAALCLVVSAASASCGGGDAHFDVKYAPGFPQASTKVSVFGVFKDGRVSAESWDELGPRVSPAFGGGLCETAYSAELLATRPGLASAVDDFARANGVTDSLLDLFGAAAKGEIILFFTVSGHVSPRSNPPSQQVTGAPAQMGRGGGMGRRQPTSSMSEPTRGKDRGSTFEVSATMYSVHLHTSVALVTMTYSGPSAEEALKAFAEQLKAAIPSASCTGWNFSVPVDEERIRHLEP